MLLSKSRKFKLARTGSMTFRASARQVMETPPTVTVTTTLDASLTRGHPAAHDLSGSASVTSPGLGGAAFSYGRAALPIIGGSTYPGRTYVRMTSLNLGASTGANGHSVRVVHRGTRIAFVFVGNGQKVVLKVDDEYVSLTPYTVPTGGAVQYVDVLFASAAARTIEVIQSTADRFGGAWIEATGGLSPASIRGPRCIVAGDSYSEGTGADGGTTTNQWQVMSDCLGWDDVWSAGLGGTGYLNNASTKLSMRDQITQNVVPFAPSVVILSAGRNDTGSTYADLLAEVLYCIDLVRAQLPSAVLIIDQPGGYATPTKMTASFWTAHRAVKAAAALRGVPLIGVIEMALPAGTTPHQFTLNAAASASATSLTVNGATPTTGAHIEAVYESGYDQIRIRTKTMTGSNTVNLDGTLLTAQPSGTVFTQVGDCMFSGTGYVGATTGYGSSDVFTFTDSAHMAQAGHEMAGYLKAEQIIALLAA